MYFSITNICPTFSPTFSYEPKQNRKAFNACRKATKIPKIKFHSPSKKKPNQTKPNKMKQNKKRSTCCWGRPIERYPNLNSATHSETIFILNEKRSMRCICTVVGSPQKLQVWLTCFDVLIFPHSQGEGVLDERVKVVKTHFPERSGYRSFEAEKAILLVRNPFDAISSYFNMCLTQAHDKRWSECGGGGGDDFKGFLIVAKVVFFCWEARVSANPLWVVNASGIDAGHVRPCGKTVLRNPSLCDTDFGYLPLVRVWDGSNVSQPASSRRPAICLGFGLKCWAFSQER